MNVFISLSATTDEKSRGRLSSPEASTERTDLSEYASLEKKLREHEEEKDKEKLAE